MSEGLPQSRVTTSGRTVIVALLANLLIVVAKGVAALLTGSAALLAETAHSLADSANELLLYIGVRRARHPPDPRHPFGYGQSRYFWSLLAAVGIFVVGGVAAIAEGVTSLRRPEALSSLPIGLAVLAVSALFEGLSLRTARRNCSRGRRPGTGPRRSRSEHRRIPRRPPVFLEDSAALIGIGMATMALLVHAATGSAVADGVASLVIGLLLIVVASLLARRNAALLIDESTPPDVARPAQRRAGRSAVDRAGG